MMIYESILLSIMLVILWGGFIFPIILLPILFIKKIGVSKKQKILFSISSFIPILIFFIMAGADFFMGGYEIHKFLPFLLYAIPLVIFVKFIFSKATIYFKIINVMWLIFMIWTICILCMIMDSCFMGACC